MNTGTSSNPLDNIKSELEYIALRQKEDSRYDVKPPERSIEKEGFADAPSERLALIAVCAIAVFIIMVRN